MVRLKAKYLFSPRDEFKDVDLSDFLSVIDAFERRIDGWFFDSIEQLLGNDNSLFVATAIECMLVDALAGFWFGVKRSRGNDFVDFLVQRMNFRYQVAKAFYDRFRNGILHQINIKKKSCISKAVKDLHLDNDVLFFNPEGFYKRLKEYFGAYLVELRSAHSCVHKFKKRFRILFKDEFGGDKWILWQN